MGAVNDFDDESDASGLMGDIWRHPWARVLLIAATVAVVSWAVRETAFITAPLASAAAAVALPLAIGFTIAYIISPLVEMLRRIGINRVLGSLVLYALILVALVVVVSLVVPAMIRQSADLAARTFQDHWYYDRDNDGRFGNEEPVLTRLATGDFLDDRDGDGQVDSGERVYPSSDLRVREEASLTRHVALWVRERQEGLQRLLGRDLDRRRLRFLAFYRRELAPAMARLDEGMRVAREMRPFDQWPAFLREDSGSLPDLDEDWDWGRSWPGVLPDDYDVLADELSSDLTKDQRDAWREVMRFYGRCFVYRHSELLASWDAWVRGYPVSSAPATDEPQVDVDPSLDPVDQQRIAAELQALADSPARRFLDAWLQRDRRVLGRHLRTWLDSVDGEAVESPPASDEGETGDEIADLLDHVHAAADAEVDWGEELVKRLRREGGGDAVLENFVQRLDSEVRIGLQELGSEAGRGIKGVFTNISGFLALLLDLMLIPIYAFFLTLAMPAIRRTSRLYIPARGRVRTLRILHDIERVVAAFFRGRLIVCLICAVLIWIGFSLLGVPYAGLFGLLIGLATTVPLAGLLFLIPACLLVMVEGGDGVILRLALTVGIYSVVQTLEMTVFTPTIMGREVELHPVMLIIALLVFGHLWGILGLILAVPIAASLRILAREFVLPRIRGLAALPAESRLWRKPPDEDQTAT